MGALLGLCIGLGLVLVLSSFAPPRDVAGGPPRRHSHARRLLDEAGLVTQPTAALWALSATTAFLVGVVAIGISRSTNVALVFALGAAYLPWAVVGARGRRRRAALAHLWPDVVDDLTSAVRAGMSLSEALAQLGERGPKQLRPAFGRFAIDHRAGARFSDCLDRLKAELADPVGDRVVEALRLAREVGGNDLGSLLRTLSQFLRDDARIRGELQSRQAWTVNGARLAVSAPWFVLALLASRPQAVAAYDSPTGAVILGAGAVVCLVAYRVMMRIGRLPREPRVLA